MKYYFITYQAKNRGGGKSTWNQVIDTSPMHFINHIEMLDSTHYCFVVLNTLEITKDEFDEYEDKF